jgi:hypothetical protein
MGREGVHTRPPDTNSLFEDSKKAYRWSLGTKGVLPCSAGIGCTPPEEYSVLQPIPAGDALLRLWSRVATENHRYAFSFRNSHLVVWWVHTIDNRCNDGRFWLSAHDCQVQTPTSQNLDVEQQIRIFEITISRITYVSICLSIKSRLTHQLLERLKSVDLFTKKAKTEKLELGLDNPCRIVFWVCRWTSDFRGLIIIVFGILSPESSATQWYQDDAPIQQFITVFLIAVASIVYGRTCDPDRHGQIRISGDK